MKGPQCPRAWQAEAVEDGRLPEADAASFERHAASCAICARERHALVALRQTAQRLPVLTSTPLEHRRLRNQLLRRADQLAVGARHGSHTRLLAAALMVAALGAALLFWLPSRAPAPSSRAAAAGAAPTFQITPSEATTWRVLTHGPSLRVALTRGRLLLAVQKLRADQRFLLELPDGELEVQGTRFAVSTDGVRTERVQVFEGRVALRLRGHVPQSLGAGEQWPREAGGARAARQAAVVAPSPDRTAPLGTVPSHESVPRPQRGRMARDDGGADPASVTDAARTPSAGASAAPSAGRTFNEAMAAFSAGDYGRAEQLFVSFEREHPSDTRVEDALFLRAVAQSRRGDVNAARTLARDYLRRYPHGLRSAEVERLTR